MKQRFLKIPTTLSTVTFVILIAVQLWSLWAIVSIDYTWDDNRHRQILWFDTGFIDYQYDDWGREPEKPRQAWEFNSYPGNLAYFEWRTLGFKYENDRFPPGVGRHLHVGVPYWPFMLATGVLPFRWTKTHLRRRRGLCLNCGYDLRASKDRCPECGTLIPPTSAMKTQI
jgi:hypothetical protein